MTRKSRLRVQKKKERKVWLSMAFFCLVGLLCWQSPLSKSLVTQLDGIIGLSAGDDVADRVDRGSIYDRNYKELAISLEQVALYGVVREIDDAWETAVKLSAVLEKTPEEISSLLNSDAQRIWIQQSVDQIEEDRIRQLNLPGIGLHTKTSRYYPEHQTAAHLIGFSEGNIGLAGIEYQYDRIKDLSSRRSSDSSDFVATAHAEESANKAESLVLTVDLKIQKSVNIPPLNIITFAQPVPHIGHQLTFGIHHLKTKKLLPSRFSFTG